MRNLALLALLVPVAATADDEVTTTTTTTTADGTTTTTTTTAPGMTEPVTPPAVEVAPAVEEDPCAYKHGHWRSRMRGRLSIGFSKSHVENEDESEGHARSLVARLNGRRGWSIELEFAKTKLDAGDTSKTAGASIVKAFGWYKLAPYVLAGGGGGRYEHADGTEQKLHFGEIGGGLMLRGKRFSIGVDVRRGVRKFKEEDGDVMRVSNPTGEEDDHDHYTRGRVLALINF